VIRARPITWAAIAALAALLFGNQGFRDFWRARREHARLTRALEDRRTERASLEQELHRLQEDPSYTEFLVRKNLGYIKKNEVEYRVLKQQK
jgi:cell division protein FtsB